MSSNKRWTAIAGMVAVLATLGLAACEADDETTATSEVGTATASEVGTAMASDRGTRLSLEERIEQHANDWAALFAAGGFKPGLWRYMGQPAGERMVCERAGNRPIENCTPPSAEFRESFAGATVERDVVSEDHRHARAEFSNGESVEFEGQRADEWEKGWGRWAFSIPERWVKNAGRS